MSMNYVSFNQDYSHMAVGTPNGFRIYYTDPFAECHSTNQGNVSLLEMLFSTSLVALVLSPRRLVISNTKRQSTICELTFPTTILAVRLNRKRLVVVLEDQIYLYDISNMKLVHTIDTSPNPGGICALSPSSERCFLAYPLPQRSSPSFTRPSHIPPNSPHQQQSVAPASGHVMIFDALSLTAVNVIEAHRAPLSCITVNSDGTRLATASDKGTIIRVFSIPDTEKLFQFRRGSMPARIYSLAFNVMSTLLCVSSGSDTVHVFKLAKTSRAVNQSNSDVSRSPGHSKRVESQSLTSDSDENPYDETEGQLDTESSMHERAHDGSFAGMIRRTSQNVSWSVTTRVGGYLPTVISEMLEPTRDFAWIKLPRSQSASSSLKSVVALSSSSPQIMVVTNEGLLLVYNIDLERGGEGTLTKQYSILEDSEKAKRFTTNIGLSP